MASQSWQTTLTTNLTETSIAEMRDWLRINGAAVPARNDDVLAKYLAHVLISNSLWDGISLDIVIPRPRRTAAGAPRLQEGSEWDDWGDADDPAPTRLYLAVCGLCLFVMTAALATLSVEKCSSSPSPNPPVLESAMRSSMPCIISFLAGDFAVMFLSIKESSRPLCAAA